MPGEIVCIKEWRKSVRRVSAGTSVAVDRRRASAPHMWEMEAIARRGC